MNTPAVSALLHTPRYVQLAQTLLNEIGAGRYPVGSQLPTEYALCEQFGVSRSTAREALKRLTQLGLVVRQPRVGTTVRATEPNSAYRQHTAGVADLYRYATDTTLVIESRAQVCLDAAQAEPLQARVDGGQGAGLQRRFAFGGVDVDDVVDVLSRRPQARVTRRDLLLEQ